MRENEIGTREKIKTASSKRDLSESTRFELIFFLFSLLDSLSSFSSPLVVKSSSLIRYWLFFSLAGASLSHLVESGESSVCFHVSVDFVVLFYKNGVSKMF